TPTRPWSSSCAGRSGSSAARARRATGATRTRSPRSRGWRTSGCSAAAVHPITGSYRQNHHPVIVVVGISGASGAIYGVRLLEVRSRGSDTQPPLAMSAGAETTIRYETGRDPADVAALADVTHAEKDLAAPLASGSFLTDGMVIAPCSMRTLSGVAN